MSKRDLLEFTSKLIAESGMSIPELIANAKSLEKYLNSRSNTVPIQIPSFEDFCSKIIIPDPITGKTPMVYRPYYSKLYALASNNHDVVVCNERQCGISTFWLVYSLYEAIVNQGKKIIILTKSKSYMDTLNFIFYNSMNDTIGKYKYNSNMIEFDNGSVITVQPPAGYSLRGATADVIIIDDADFISYSDFSKLISSIPLCPPNDRKVLISSHYSGNQDSLFIKKYTNCNASISITR